MSVGEYSDRINSLHLERNRKLRQRISAIKRHERVLPNLQGEKQKETEKYVAKLKKEVVDMYRD